MNKKNLVEGKISKIARTIALSDKSIFSIRKFLSKEFAKNNKERKLILSKVKSLRREKRIAEEILQDRRRHELNEDSKVLQHLSATDRKYLRKFRKGKEKESKLHRQKLWQAREMLYQYFRKKGHAGGIEKGMLEGMDDSDRLKIVYQATDNFEIYNDYKNRFFSVKRKDRLHPDQLPKEGMTKYQEKFFNDAREDYLLERSGRGFLAGKPGPEKSVDLRPKNIYMDSKATEPQIINSQENQLEIHGAINSLKGKEKKLAQELSGTPWYKKASIKTREVELLKRIGYQENDMNHKVYDFDGKLVDCIAYKPKGFRNDNVSNDKRESLHHFSRPYLLKQIVPGAEILVRMESLDGEDRTIDAAVTLLEGKAEKKAAIEFQESHFIDAQRILNKVKPILEKFDVLIIVCKDTFFRVYKKISHPNLFVLDNRGFKSKLREWKLIK